MSFLVTLLAMNGKTKSQKDCLPSPKHHISYNFLSDDSTLAPQRKTKSQPHLKHGKAHPKSLKPHQGLVGRHSKTERDRHDKHKHAHGHGKHHEKHHEKHDKHHERNDKLSEKHHEKHERHEKQHEKPQRQSSSDRVQKISHTKRNSQHKLKTSGAFRTPGSTVSGEIENLIHMDASHLMNYFSHAYDDVKHKVTKPNVLITGVTGAGKSSIVNTVFGFDLAKVGSGKPITQHFTKYELEDKNVIIYDSKGLEHGKHENFLQETQQFFEEHEMTKKGDGSNCIHVIWYVISSAGARFQKFEETLCKNIFNIPIIFILSKADVSSVEERKAIRDLLEEMELDNCIGIFETISAEHAKKKLKSIGQCPNCGSEDLMINQRKKIMICEDCSHEECLKLDTGLEEVVQATVDVLPKVSKEAFISAQRISFELKERRARRVLRDFQYDFHHVKLSHGLLKILAKMITRLSILWEFREHGHLYGIQLAKELIGCYSFKDKLSLMMGKDKNKLNDALALGVLWNRCVRNLAMKLFHDTFECHISLEEEEKRWSQLMDESFNVLNDDELHILVDEIAEIGLDSVLDQEMPVGKLGLRKREKKRAANVNAIDGPQ